MDLLGTEKVYGCIPFQPVCFITISGLVGTVNMQELFQYKGM